MTNTAQTYNEVRAEIDLVARKQLQVQLVALQKNAESLNSSRTYVVEEARKAVEAAKEKLAQAEKNQAEIAANVREFVEKVEALGNKDVITNSEVQALKGEYVNVTKTEAEKEADRKFLEKRRPFDGEIRRHSGEDYVYVNGNPVKIGRWI